jgi:hypothetical protein
MARRYIVPVKPKVTLDVEGAYLIAPHWPFDRDVLEIVRAEMRRRGCVVIRAMWDGDGWRGIEGSHRTFVASQTGTTVSIQRVEPEYRFQHDEPEFGIVTAAWLLDSCQTSKRGRVARYAAI